VMGASRPKKRTKTGLSRYIDDMAEEDDEEFDDRDLSARVDKEDKDLRSEMERQDRRRNQETLFEGADADVAGVVNSLHERYSRTKQIASDLDNIHDGMPCAHDASLTASRKEATRQANAPSLTDPRLWLVPCKSGCERESVISLMNKCIAKGSGKSECGVCSAMATGLRGFIYLESRSEAVAHETLRGLRLLRGWSMMMVPISDMMAVVATDANLQCGTRHRRFKVGDWARVSRDKYRNDLCRIASLGDGGSSAIVMLVPRIDPRSHVVERAASVHQVRPPRRLFNVSEVTAAGGNVSQGKFRLNGNTSAASHNWALSDSTFDIYENSTYLQGFLYKEVSVASMLQTADANPTLDELQRFAVDTGDKDSHQASLVAEIKHLARGSGTKMEKDPVQRVIAMYSPNDKAFHLCRNFFIVSSKFYLG